MANVPAIPDFTPTQMDTIKRTVAKDANETEFDLFMGMAREYGLNPFKKHLHIIIYSKDKAEKRSHAIFPSRDGFRILAARQKDYRPAEGPAEFEYDENLKDPQRNPLGIVKCGIYLKKKDPDSGEWHPVYGEAYWDEFAKVQEEWAWDKDANGRRPTGKFELSGGWKTMPRLMIQKCAEGQALRSGWPDTFGGLYAEEEIRMPHERAMKDITPDQDLSPSERVAKQKAHDRANLLGKPGVMMVFDDTMVLTRVEMGAVYDRVAEFIKTSDQEEVMRFRVRNEESLREYWASQPGDALELKKLFEAKLANYSPADEKEIDA